MDARDIGMYMMYYIYIYTYERAVVYTVVEYGKVKRFASLHILQLRNISVCIPSLQGTELSEHLIRSHIHNT